MYSLSPEIKTIWAIGVFTSTIFYTLIVFAIDFFILDEFIKNWTLPFGVLPGIVFLIGITMTFIYPNLAYKYWSFEIREKDIVIKHGILTRVESLAPFVRVQHLDVQQGIMDRMFGLGKLIIFTAGTRGADLVIPGLPIAYAEALRDQLKNYTREDAV